MIIVSIQGFEILFGIMRSEGGPAEAGIVVKDCLLICCNMLQKSEICQRFFFGMGKEWVVYLTQFFSSEILENIRNADSSEFGSPGGFGEGNNDDGMGGDGVGSGGGSWYLDPTRVQCASLALHALAGALLEINPKHQLLVALQTNVIPSASFWLARRGPDTMVDAVLNILLRVVANNAEVAANIADMILEITPSKGGVTHPFGEVDLGLQFAWQPLHSKGRKLISIPALLAERYIFTSTAWRASALPLSLPSLTDITTSGVLSVRCLNVLESLLRADSSTCDLMVQFILAPPPPTEDGDGDGQGDLDMTAMGSMR